jgi:hypothetical protein
MFGLFIINTCLKGQTGIDYYPKMLQKELDGRNGKNCKIKDLSNHAACSGQIPMGKFYLVNNGSPFQPIKYVYIGRVNTCRAGGCSINNTIAGNQQSEFFDYYILYDSTCTIREVRIFNYQATHGQEVTARSWLKQFQGYRGERELTTGKNIDALSGATISADAATFDIEHKTALLKQVDH